MVADTPTMILSEYLPGSEPHKLRASDSSRAKAARSHGRCSHLARNRYWRVQTRRERAGILASDCFLSRRCPDRARRRRPASDRPIVRALYAGDAACGWRARGSSAGGGSFAPARSSAPPRPPPPVERRRNELGTGQVEAGGERFPLIVVRLLLGDRRKAERAARGNAQEGSRLSTDLSADNRPVIHEGHVNHAARSQVSSPHLRSPAHSALAAPRTTCSRRASMAGASLAAPPAVNPLDDIQPLSGLDVEEASRRTLDRPTCRCALELLSQLVVLRLSLIHISEPTRLGMISYAVFCLK